ET
ncbi:conserved carboxylase domain protein, partial [Vibrio parahaemolyticus V-223/04]